MDRNLPAVVITGCNKGIGKAIFESLEKKVVLGYMVYAVTMPSSPKVKMLWSTFVIYQIQMHSSRPRKTFLLLPGDRHRYK